MLDDDAVFEDRDLGVPGAGGGPRPASRLPRPLSRLASSRVEPLMPLISAFLEPLLPPPPSEEPDLPRGARSCTTVFGGSSGEGLSSLSSPELDLRRRRLRR